MDRTMTEIKDNYSKCPAGHDMHLSYVHYDAIKSKCGPCKKYFAYSKNDPQNTIHEVSKNYFVTKEGHYCQTSPCFHSSHFENMPQNIIAYTKLDGQIFMKFDQVQQHDLFFNACKQYINECLDNKAGSIDILKSFENIIIECMRDRKK